MNKEFIINIIFLITINLLIKPFYIFGIDRTIQNAVGTDSYGMYFSLFNFTYLLQIINDFGIQNFNNRTISQHQQLIYKFIPNILALKLILAVLYGLAIALLTWISGYEARHYQLIFLLSLNWVLISLIFYFRSNISGLAYYKTDSLISTIDKFLMIIVGSILLWVYPGKAHFRIEWLVYLQTFAFIITALISGLVMMRITKHFSFVIRKNYILLLLKKSWPYALLIFLMMVYTRIDAVMLERLLPDGEHETGIYASAYRLLDAINMIGFLFAGLLLPMFARLIKKGESISDLLRLSAQLILIFSVPLSMTTILFRNELMSWLYIEATDYSGSVLAWLMLAFIAISSNYIFGTLLTANGSLSRMNKAFIFGVLMNIVLNYWLIFEYKALGTAATTCMTQFFVLFVQMILVKTEFRLKVDYKVILRIIFFVLAIGLAVKVASWLPDIDWRIRYVGVMVTALPVAILSGLLQPGAIFLLLKSR